MITLDQISAQDLQALPRAREQRIDRSVTGWVTKLAEAGASQAVLDATARYDTLPNRSRENVTVLLSDCADDPIARTAIVFLWGGARGRNATLAVCRPPRTGSLDESRLRDAPDPQREAHAFLWDPHRSWVDYRGPARVDPAAAFLKLWAEPRWADGLLQGCGTAFGTKLLYWAARVELGWDTHIADPIPLIYDARVAASLARRGPTTVYWPHPRAKMPSATYQAFCEYAYDSARRLNGRARDLGVDGGFMPDDVERWHFDLGGSDPAPIARESPAEGGGPETNEPDVEPLLNYDPPRPDLLDRVLRSLTAAA